MKEFIKISLGLLLVIICSLSIYAADLITEGESIVCDGANYTYKAEPVYPLNPDFPSDYETHVADSFAWEVVNGIIISGPTEFSSVSSSTVDVDWGTTACEEGKIIAKYKLVYKDLAGITKIKLYKDTIDIEVREAFPTLSITGTNEIPCDSEDEFSYEIAGCADSYNWNFPPGWVITDGSGTNSVTVTPSSSTGGDITVTAWGISCIGGSLEATLTVLRKCSENENYLSPTDDLPPHTPVNNAIHAGATSGGWVEVVSGQTIRFRAGNRIVLKPNFRALSGAYFNAKIGPCTDCYAFRPGGGTVSSEELVPNFNKKTNIYPNPTNGQFTIDLSDEENFTISIFNVQGQEIYSNNNASGKLELDLTEKPQGIYLVKIASGSDVKVERIIKQ